MDNEEHVRALTAYNKKDGLPIFMPIQKGMSTDFNVLQLTRDQ